MAIVAVVAVLLMAGGVFVQIQHANEDHSRKKRASEPDWQSTRTTDSRKRDAPDLSTDALCGRIVKSLRTRNSDEVYQSIRSSLRHLSTDDILARLGGLDSTACSDVRSVMEVLLLGLLAKNEPALTADYLFSNNGAGDIHWDHFSESFFDGWIHEDIEAATAWLDRHHQDLPSDGSIIVISRAETALISRLIKGDPQAALDRVKSFPPSLAFPVTDSTFRRNSYLLVPDQAIGFIRDALGNENHEALVGYVCGVQLYSKGPGGIQEFFRKHDATLPEREAIIRESVEMEVNMGYGGDTEAFLQRSRALAGEEAPGALDHVTAVILGVIASRDREDRLAVDTLLGFDPDDDALRTFLKARGADIDEIQRVRIEERLALTPGSSSPQTEPPHPP